MPVYQRDGRTIHHIHIPRAGGKSVTDLLKRNGWIRINLPVIPPFEESFSYEERPKKWEPIFIDSEHRDLWKAWFDGDLIKPEFQFALIRNPFERFDSCLRKLALNPEAISWDIGLKGQIEYRPPVRWLHKFMSIIMNQNPYSEKNLFNKQSNFLNDGVMVYKIENAVEQFIQDLIEKDIVSPNSSLSLLNKSPINLKIKVPWYTDEYQPCRVLFGDLYKEDFQSLKYPWPEIIGESNRK